MCSVDIVQSLQRLTGLESCCMCQKNVLYTYCIVHGSRFLHPEGLHHLEGVHYSLHLAPLNGGGYGTEHARAAHRITAGNTHSAQSHTMLLEH